ncbi:hypothetical protein ACFL1X_01460 [Candidatus Hydrogenedentota bacterium]
MEFCWEDGKDHHRIFIDQKIDDKADRFQPCGTCLSALCEQEHKEKTWNELPDLCYDCVGRLSIESAVADIQDRRPVILDRPPEVINLDTLVDLTSLDDEIQNKYYDLQDENHPAGLP